MRIKKFTGPSVRDVTDQMKKEFGEDAIILHAATRRETTDANRELYEITAAVDTAGLEADSGRGPETESFGQSLSRMVSMAEKTDFRPRPRMTGNRRDPATPAGENRAESGLRRTGGEERLFGAEMAELRSTMREVADHLRTAKIPLLPESLRGAYEKLAANDVDPALAAELVHGIRDKTGELGMLTAGGVEQAIMEAIAARIRTGVATSGRSNRPKVVALVGPTGVGKTTTIAKLSAIEKLMHGRTVGLISFDTYRIGAVEQLRMFASITDLPMEVASSPAEVRSLCAGFREHDVVFIDTVGRSQRKEKELRELREMVAAAEPDETHLVVSATSGRKTLRDIIDRFMPLSPTNLIFSKIDEAVTTGALLSAVAGSAPPVSYLTTGQTVPYDILEADPEQIASLMWEGELAHA